MKRDQELGSGQSQTPPDLGTKDSSLPNDAYSKLKNLTDRNQIEPATVSDTPIFEKKSHILSLLKVTAWIVPSSAIAYSLLLYGFPRLLWGLVPLLIIVLFGAAFCLQMVPNFPVLRLFNDRIEWRRRFSVYSAKRYRVIVTHLFGLAVREDDADNASLEGLPLNGTMAEPLHLIYHFRRLGVPVNFPKHRTWADFSQGSHFYKIDRLIIMRILGILIPSICTFAAMFLFYWNPSYFHYWPLLVVLALFVCVLGSLFARKAVRREDGFLFDKGKVSKIVGNEQIWTVPKDEIRHIQFAAVDRICRFELVTHYGRTFSLPSDPKVSKRLELSLCSMRRHRKR